MPNSNENVVELLVKLWNTGDLGLVPEVYGANAERADPGSSVPLRGTQAIAEYIAEVHKGFPDFHIVIDQRVSEGESYAHTWTCTGTHRGEYMGMAPTGKHVELRGVAIGRLQDGKIAQEANYFDQLALMQQLGALPGGVSVSA